MFKPATSNQQPATSNQQPATSNQQPAFKLGFTLSELLVSLAVLGLIAGLTVPSIVNSVDISRQKAVLKEHIQAISQIVQEGYMDGTFAGISNWSVLNTTDPLVQYFTSKLGGVAKQCPRGTVAPPCDIRMGNYDPSLTATDHSGRWVMMNGSTLTLLGDMVNQNSIAWVINSKPQLNNGIGRQMAVVCNIRDTPQSLSSIPSFGLFKPAQCGPLWAEDQDDGRGFYLLTWGKLFS